MLDYLSPTSALLGIIVGILMYWLLKKKYHLPPGPYPLPLLGNLKVMRAKFQHEVIENYTKQYGPIVTVYLGPVPMVVLNSLELANEALVKKGADFADRMHTSSLDFLTENRKDIAMSDYTPRWKLHRKIVSKALRNFIKGSSMERTLHGVIGKMITMLKDKKEPFNPKQAIDLTVFNIMCSICYGTSYGFDDEEFLNVMKTDYDLNEAADAGFLEDVFPYFQAVWKTPSYNKFTKNVDFMLKFINEKIAKHRQSFDPENPRDFTDDLLKARHDAETEEDKNLLSQLTDAHLRQTLLDILFAGIDTSRFTLYWCFLYMAAYPDIQRKCQAEIDSVVDRDGLPKPSDKPHLPYTEATLHEIMRIGTVVPLGVPHAARVDSTLGGYDIPKGTGIAVNHNILHMDPKYWSEPDKFDPTRFLESDGSLAQKPEAWLPFSAGQRVCIGQSFAKPELLIVFGSFLQKFNIKIPDGEKADLSSDGSSFAAYPKDYKIELQCRA